ncbi:hypothetical protein C8R43DRAFT_994506 [Mycena crocata]|nr:hypothetical protein C8R43DRAFT_994506 [Mycena crocata]
MHILAPVCTLSVVFLISLAAPLKIQFSSSTETSNIEESTGLRSGLPSGGVGIPKSTTQGIDSAGPVQQSGISFPSDPQPTNGLDSFTTIDLSAVAIAGPPAGESHSHISGCFSS